MNIAFAGLVGAVIAFLILFRRASALRHLVAFVGAAIVTGFLVRATPQVLYVMPSPGYRPPDPFSWTAVVAMALLAPIVGILAARLWRRRGA